MPQLLGAGTTVQAHWRNSHIDSEVRSRDRRRFEQTKPQGQDHVGWIGVWRNACGFLDVDCAEQQET